MLTAERLAYPGNHAVPMALFCGGIVDQHALLRLQRLYRIRSLRMLETTKKAGVIRL
jgi:hypothetical protein